VDICLRGPGVLKEGERLAATPAQTDRHPAQREIVVDASFLLHGFLPQQSTPEEKRRINLNEKGNSGVPWPAAEATQPSEETGNNPLKKSPMLLRPGFSCKLSFTPVCWARGVQSDHVTNGGTPNKNFVCSPAGPIKREQRNQCR